MKRLLIVDDSKLMRDMVAACLRPLGDVSFEYAGTGLEARVLASGASGFLAKPFSPPQILDEVRRLMTGAAA